VNPTQARRIEEARAVLSKLGFAPAQANERSALTLLALLGLRPVDSWAKATDGTYRVVDIMAFVREHYGRDYAPNSRETFRRQTLHQFVEAALALFNPDDPARPVNSGKNCYQVEPRALALLRTHGTSAFERSLRKHVAAVPGLQARYARERAFAQIPVSLPGGTSVTLTPGGQNVLLKQMAEEFCPRFTPGGQILYVGDAGKSDPVFDEQAFHALGVTLDKHGKLPDLVVYLPDREWLVLMEAAASHGPVDAKRHVELTALFGASRAGLVFVSCFPSRVEMRKYLPEIAWETEVWCADHPDHLIHFNGERFLGPYDVLGC